MIFQFFWMGVFIHPSKYSRLLATTVSRVAISRFFSFNKRTAMTLIALGNGSFYKRRQIWQTSLTFNGVSRNSRIGALTCVLDNDHGVSFCCEKPPGTPCAEFLERNEIFKTRPCRPSNMGLCLLEHNPPSKLSCVAGRSTLSLLKSLRICCLRHHGFSFERNSL